MPADRDAAAVAGPGRRGPGLLAHTGGGFVVVGVVLAAAGVLLGVDRAVDLPVDIGGIIAGWWPLIPVALGGQRLARGRPGGVVVTLLALLLLAVTTGGVGWLIDTLPRQNLLAPLLLIAVGVAVLAGGTVRSRRRGRDATRWGGGERGPAGDGRSAVAVFSDAEVVVDGDRGADDQPVEATAVFGDARVLVPAGMAVTLQETVIFGEIEAPAAPAEPTGHVVVEATAVFGEVKILRY